MNGFSNSKTIQNPLGHSSGSTRILCFPLTRRRRQLNRQPLDQVWASLQRRFSRMRSGLERAKNHTCFYCDLAEWNTPPPLALMVPDVLGDHAESATNAVTLEIQPLSNGGPHNT